MRQILLAAGFLGGAMPALFAQTAPASPPTPPTPSTVQPAAAQPAAPQFSESVVVTSSLEPEQRDDTPAAATVIDSAEIESRQARSLADLVWSVPGVTVAQAGPPGQQTSVFIRGANSNQTLLLWNGIPLNDPYFGDINWQFVPTEGAERVEVVRGPYSALYGSNAVGGVVQVITARRQGILADIEGGGDGNVLGQVAAGSNFGPVHLDVIGHGQSSAGTLDNDFFDGEEGVVRALWAVLPSTNAGVLLRANDSETGVPFSSGIPTPQTTISWQERELAVPFDYTGGRWLVNAQLSDTRFNSSFRSPDDPFGAYDSDSRSQTLDGRAVGSYHLVQQPGQNLEISLGTEGEGFRVTDVDSFGTNLDRTHQRTWAGFGEIRWSAGPVHLDAGLRRDDNDVFGGQTSLRAGGVWRLAGHTLLRASYGQAFRAPTLGELYFPFSGNPNLRPEASTNYEVGLEQTMGGLRFSVTGFESHQRNLIEFDNFTFMDVNVDRSRSRGLEGVIDYRQGIVRAEINGTLLNAVDETTNQELLRRPKGSANLILTLSPGDWNLNLAGRYEGRRADLDPVSDATTTNPGYVRIDLAGRWQALHWLAPFARIQNLADRHYDEVLGYPSLGRTFFGGVAVQL